MKKNVLLLIACLLTFVSYAQQEDLYNMKLTVEEKDVIKATGKVFRECRKYLSSEKLLCEGALVIHKSPGRPQFNQIGEWKYYYENGSVRELFVFDKEGYLQQYEYYEPDGFNSYSCEYLFKNIKGKLYRVEHSKTYYLSGQIRLEAYRLNKIKVEKGIIRRKPTKDIGIHTYYNEDGEVIKQKKSRMGLARKLGIVEKKQK